MAARGVRNLDSGEEVVEDKDTELGLRQIARKVHFMAVLTALVLTLLIWIGAEWAGFSPQ